MVTMNGRRAQAARNDERILDAARAVFLADPDAPIAAVAERAEVGIGALYRRHGSKEDLLRRICADALAAYIADAETALADDDPGAAFAAFMRDQVDADAYAIGRLAGRFPLTSELRNDLNRGFDLAATVLERAQAAGTVRADIVPTDIGVLFRLVGSVAVPDDTRRTAELRHRYLALLFDALFTGRGPELPGPAPHREEFARPWYTPTAH